MDVQQGPVVDLFSTLSHELRSPLTSIEGYSSTLIKHDQSLTSEERLEFLHEIHDASKRLENVVDRLFEIAQFEADTIALESTIVDSVKLVRETIRTAEQRWQTLRRHHTPQNRVQPEAQDPCIIFSFDDGLFSAEPKELLIHGDRQRLKEVLDNLLENAILYSPQGGCIEVGIRSLADRNPTSQVVSTLQRPMIEIWVRDRGIGIPAKHLRHIFECFHRVDTSLSREVGGMGLGLAICKRIVELHNGIIWAESEVGKGSTFHILLPLGE